jgi:hypothetical protein
VGKPEGRRPLGRSRLRWVDNIRMDTREIEWCGMDWIDVAQIGTRGCLLWTRQWTYGFHNMLITPWVAAELPAPQEGLSSISK